MEERGATSGAAGLLPRQDGTGLTPVSSVAAVRRNAEEGGDEEVNEEGDEELQHDEPTGVWKRNERLVYLINFLHMTMMTFCLGGVWDIFVYTVSQNMQTLASDPFWIGPGLPFPSSQGVHTFSEFALTFDVWPSASMSDAPFDCKENFTCATALLHLTDGSGNGDCCAVGNRVPAIYFLNGTTQLHVMMDSPDQPETVDHRVYDESQMCFSDSQLEPETWSRIKVKQCNRGSSKGRMDDPDSDGALMLFVNGEKKCEINKTRSAPMRPIKSAHAFFGPLQFPLQDPHVAAHAMLRDVKYCKPASNVFFGLVNSVQGVAGLIFMYPIGWLGDRTNRYNLLRLNVGIGVASAVLIVLTIIFQSQVLLFVGILVWAGYQQCLSSTIYTVLSDNVRRGQRGRASVNYKTISALAMAFGPGIQYAVLLFEPSSDQWTSSTFWLLLLPGWLMLPFVALAVHFVTPVGRKLSSLPNTDEVPRPERARPPLVSDGRRTKDEARVLAGLTQSFLDEPVMGKWKRRYVVAVSAQIFFVGTLLANGMTVRYFSLYYTQILRFKPTELCLLNAVCRVWIAIFVQAVSRLSSWIGRTNLCVLLHVSSALFTLGIYGGGFGVPPLWVSCVCYFLRYGFLQARDPLLYSITMDIVPVDQRSRWAALNSLRTLSFSGSALIGGFVADSYGYQFSFQVTVVALLGSTLLFFPAWFGLPRHEGAGRLLRQSSGREEDVSPEVPSVEASVGSPGDHRLALVAARVT